MVGNLEYLELPEGELPLREGTLDLAGLCRELGEQVSPLTALAGIRFSYEEEIGSLLTHGDGAQLRRLLLNLIANAVRAAGEGGESGLRLARRGGGRSSPCGTTDRVFSRKPMSGSCFSGRAAWVLD